MMMDGSAAMSATTDSPAAAGFRPWARRAWVLLQAVALGSVTLALYLSPKRDVSTDDTAATALLPYCILSGEGPFLDRFWDILSYADNTYVPFVRGSHGHIVSLHPIGTALVALPIEVPLMAAYDRLHPGWRNAMIPLSMSCLVLGKMAVSVIVALTVVALWGLLRRLGLGPWAMVAALAAGLTTNFWSVAAQALWPHGPAALMLTWLIAVLVREPVSEGRMFLAGLAAALLVSIRLADVIFAITALLWVIRKEPRKLPAFLLAPVFLGAALLTYNLYFFGNWVGGQADLEAGHLKLHGVAGTWSGSLVEGALGTLFSPSRGLFVYTPWILVALATLPAYASRLQPFSIVRWMLVALIPYLVVYSKYSAWWAGHTFGPRFWIDVIPLFAILLGFGLQWSAAQCRPIFALFILTLVWSLGVQLIGAYLYPSGWNISPTNIDLDHGRLWDWSDTELSRCLKKWIGARHPGS
jgi:hypothetical protein